MTSSRLIDTAPPLVLLRSPCSKEWGPRDWVRRFRRLVSATRGGTPAGADDLRFQVAQAAEQRGRRLQPLVRRTPPRHTYRMRSPGLTWATATGWGTVEDWVDARLSSRWGAAEGADFDQEGLCAEVREVVNDNLPAGWTLEENQFVGPTPIPEDTPGIIRDIIDEIDFWGMAQYYDNGD